MRTALVYLRFACPRSFANDWAELGQDFHLAKRHYDLAMEANTEAYLPAMLSLAKLYVRSLWHTLTGGTGGLSIWNSDNAECEFAYVSKTLSLLYPRVVQKSNEGRELDDGRKQNEDTSLDAGNGDEERYSDEDAGTWYIGKAKDEFNRRRNGQRLPDRRRVGEEDPIEVCPQDTNNTASYPQQTVGKRTQRRRSGPR